MFRHRIPIILATLVAFGCSEGAVAPTTGSDGGPMQASVGRVTHRVTVGSPDACVGFGGGPGCDANFSLVALQGAKGVEGQWHDLFSQATPVDGIHATVNCLVVSGNDAWISGNDPTAPAGFVEWTTMVRDNGTSANDPPDQIAFSIPSVFIGDCNVQFDFDGAGILFDAPQGQVVVR
jgi:hypothetical protein